MVRNIKSGDSAHDRLTRVCDAMAKACQDHPEGGDDVRYVLCVDSLSEKRGGLVHNHDDDAIAIARMFSHLSAILGSHGKRLEVVTIDGDEKGKT